MLQLEMMTLCCVQISHAPTSCNAVAAIDADRWETFPFRLRVPIPFCRDIPKMALLSVTVKFRHRNVFENFVPQKERHVASIPPSQMANCLLS